MCLSRDSSVVEHFHGKEGVLGSNPNRGSINERFLMQAKKFYLSTTDRKIEGVCGGLAVYFNIDSTLVRIATVIALIATGFFPVGVAYIVAAIVAPKDTEIRN